MLLDAGANTESRDNWCQRPLHTAAAGGFQYLAELLMASNADSEARDKDLCTLQACDAVAAKHPLVEYLRQTIHDPYLICKT